MSPLLLATWLALLPSAGAGGVEPEAPSPPAPDPAPTATSPSPPALSPSQGAGERGPADPPTPPTPPTPPASPAPTEPPPTWYDEGHALVSGGLLWSVERLDRFFADERELDLPRASTFVRWRNDLKIHEDGTLGFTTGLRADLSLPSLDRRLDRLHLTLSAGTTDALDRLLGADSPSPDGSDRPSAGLRLDLLRTLLTQTDLQAGLIASLPLGWYTRLRLRAAAPVDDLFVARGALSVFWQTPTGWGTRQDGRLERRLTPWLEVRLDGTGTITERSRGWEWAAELAALAAASDRVALLLGAGPSGATDLGPVVEVWRVHARVRRDVLRRWIFVEVEPGIEWRRPPLGGPREQDRYVILRLEVQFDASAHQAADEPSAPAAPAEPAAPAGPPPGSAPGSTPPPAPSPSPPPASAPEAPPPPPPDLPSAG